MATTKQQLSNLHNVGIGCASGILEVLIQQPTVSVKNALQQGQPIIWKPKVLYRGVGITCASIAPITGIQFSVCGAMGRYLTSNGTTELSISQRIFSAAVGGICSALVGSPAELVMILQQQTGKGLTQVAKEVINKYGFARLYQGFTTTAMREAAWASSYLALGPVIAETIKRKVYENNPTLSQQAFSSISGSILAGISAVIITQPIDTIKTRLQGSALIEKRISKPLTVVMDTWKEGGYKIFYRGTIPRGIRLIGAVFILGESKKHLEDYLSEI